MVSLLNIAAILLLSLVVCSSGDNSNGDNSNGDNSNGDNWNGDNSNGDNSNGVSSKDVMLEEWKEYKGKYDKKYANKKEEWARFQAFKQNKYTIAKYNYLADKGVKNFTLAMNAFGDMLSYEFVSIYNGFKKSYRTDSFNGSTYLSPAHVRGSCPKKVDWRDHGYVTPIKNQGQCGSCWAFSSTGSLEGQHFKKTGHLVSLSEQNLVDCSGGYGNDGCGGGWMDNAFEYVRVTGGIDTEKSYPYEAENGNCRFRDNKIGSRGTGFVDITSGSEDKLREAVCTIGPISVAIDASHQSFQLYSKGIYDEPDCSTDVLDHAVLVVGYGTENGQDFWLVKNSWGTGWGEDGYIKMSRNKQNQCGIATKASFPLV